VVKMQNPLTRLLRSTVAVAVLAVLALPAAAVDVVYQASRSKIMTFDKGVSAAARKAFAKEAGCRVLRELPLINALEVEPSAFKMAFTLSSMKQTGLKRVEPNDYRIWINAAPESLAAATLSSKESLLKQAREGAAEIANIDGVVLTDEDPEVAPSEQDAKWLWGIKRVKAPETWNTTTGAGVKVAVVDTGIDYSHPDIAPNYVGGYNAINPDADPLDDHGHGTHVAGTIAGAGEDKIVGVAPKASLFGVKVLDARGGGSYATIIAGIQWAVENKMDIVNMSLGGPSVPALEEAVKNAYAAGVTIVAAAGNDPRAEVSAPAMYPETIAVSASAHDDSLAFFSTTGPEVDFIAPGHEIDSTWPGGGTNRISGTSMATPHVSGLAALAVSMGASGPEGVRAALRRAAVPLEGLSAEQQGYGLPEADKWVNKIVAFNK